jgi:hypothetical protein
MDLTPQQHERLAQGELVELDVDGQKCVLLTQQAYQRVQGGGDYDASPWTREEMDLLSAEAAELLSGDGLDQKDD